MIDLDINKVTGKEEGERLVLESLEKAGLNNCSTCAAVMFGPVHAIRIQSWLDAVGAAKTGVKSQVAQFVYWLNMIALNNRPGYGWEAKQFVKRFVPELVLKKLRSPRRKP